MLNLIFHFSFQFNFFGLETALAQWKVGEIIAELLPVLKKLTCYKCPPVSNMFLWMVLRSETQEIHKGL